MNAPAQTPPRLRRSSIPKHEPRPASRVARWDGESTLPATQGTLALALPNLLEAAAASAPTEPGTESGTGSGTDETVGLLPEPNAWAATFIQAAMEVAGGLRSAGQLVRWTTPEVHSLLVRRGALTARARRGGATIGSKPRLRALLSCAPRPGVCEFSAVIAEPDRVRAVAFRMEGLHGRWRVTELQIG
jgi:Family of unknown function (DUF6459)